MDYRDIYYFFRYVNGSSVYCLLQFEFVVFCGHRFHSRVTGVAEHEHCCSRWSRRAVQLPVCLPVLTFDARKISTGKLAQLPGRTWQKMGIKNRISWEEFAIGAYALAMGLSAAERHPTLPRGRCTLHPLLLLLLFYRSPDLIVF